jgi:hypothetical protein
MEMAGINESMKEGKTQDSLISIGSQSSQTALSLIVFFLLVGVLFLIFRTLRQHTLDDRRALEEQSVEVTGLSSEKVFDTMLV